MLAAVRVTVRVYVLVTVVSAEVTTVVITFAPTLRVIAPEALPVATAIVLTVMRASGSVALGITVMLVVAKGTVAV